MRPAPRLPSLSLSVWTLGLAFEARLAHELVPLGISVSGFRLVGELMNAPDGLRTGELAKRLGVKPPSVTTLVSKLVEAGVVTLSDSPGDARGTRVRLAKNAPLHDGVEVLARLERTLAKGLGARERKALETALNTMLTNLGEV